MPTGIGKALPYILIAGLFGILILVPFDWFLGRYTVLMIYVGIYTILTVGLCLLMGYTGQVSLGQAAFYGMGAYFSAILSKTYLVNPWLAMLIGALATGTFAYVLGYPIFRLRGNYLAMATLGVGVIMYVLFRQLSQYTGGPDGMYGVPALSVGSFSFDTPFKMYFLVWFFCLAVLLVSQNVVRSRTGRALRGIHSSESAAASIGVDAQRYKVKIFVLSAVYSSLAGSLLAFYASGVTPQAFDFLHSVEIVVMAVVGGLASIWGAIFGAMTVRWLSYDVLVRFGELDVIVYGLMLALIMIFMPQGLFVNLRELYSRWRSGWDLKQSQRRSQP